MMAYFVKINIKFYMNFLILNFRTGSSSSGDNLTDDSGIHSKSTSKDSPRLVTKSIINYDQPQKSIINYDQPQKSIIKYDQPVQPVKIERVAIGRRPVRKLPAVPSSKQAHIGAEYLGFFSSRSLKTREKYTNRDNLVCLPLYIF